MASVRRSQGNSMTIDSSESIRFFAATPAFRGQTCAPFGVWVKPASRGQPGPCGQKLPGLITRPFLSCRTTRGFESSACMVSAIQKTLEPAHRVLFGGKHQVFPNYAGTALFERKLPRWLRRQRAQHQMRRPLWPVGGPHYNVGRRASAVITLRPDAAPLFILPALNPSPPRQQTCCHVS